MKHPFTTQSNVNAEIYKNWSFDVDTDLNQSEPKPCVFMDITIDDEPLASIWGFREFVELTAWLWKGYFKALLSKPVHKLEETN